MNLFAATCGRASNEEEKSDEFEGYTANNPKEQSPAHPISTPTVAECCNVKVNELCLIRTVDKQNP